MQKVSLDIALGIYNCPLSTASQTYHTVGKLVPPSRNAGRKVMHDLHNLRALGIACR